MSASDTRTGDGCRRWRQGLAALALACGGGGWAQVVSVPAAHLHHTEGSVAHAPPGDKEWHDVQPRRLLKRGDRLWTDRGSRAELQAGGHQLRIDGQTQLVLENVGDTATQLSLTQGSLAATVTRMDNGDRFEVGTPNLAFRARQVGDYRIDVDEREGVTRVVVLSGAGVAYGEQGEVLEIRNGQRLVFRDRNLSRVRQAAFAATDDFDRWAGARRRGEPTVSMPALATSAPPVPAPPLPDRRRTIVIGGPNPSPPPAKAIPAAAAVAAPLRVAAPAPPAAAAHPLPAVPPAPQETARAQALQAARNKAADAQAARALQERVQQERATAARAERERRAQAEAKRAEERRTAQARRDAVQQKQALATRWADEAKRQAAARREAENQRVAAAKRAGEERRKLQAQKAADEKRLAARRAEATQKLADAARREQLARLQAQALKEEQSARERREQAARRAEAQRREDHAREDARREEAKRVEQAGRDDDLRRQRVLADPWRRDQERREQEVWLRQQPDPATPSSRPAPMGVPARRIS